VPPIRPAFALAALLSLTTTTTFAQEDARELAEPPAEAVEATAPLQVEALVGTTAPIDVSVGARAVIYDRLLVSSSLGVGVYGGFIGAIAGSVGGEAVGDIAQELTNGVVVFRAGLGVRPFGNGGPELLASYALLHRSPTFDLATLAAAYDLEAPSGDVDASLTLHAVHFEFGWTIAIGDGFIVRPAFGWLHPIDGTAELDVPQAQTARQERVVSEVEAELDDALTSYVMTPTLSISAGWRF
jgi:hypothetical protein